jgi:glycosyltransferase involved in cell wall biosynthesis
LKVYIVRPAFNEAKYIGDTLKSLVDQTVRAEKILVVNDRSTDNTEQIVKEFSAEYDFISLITTTQEGEHSPGSKVITAFDEGFKTLDDQYNIICKFDADLIFPSDYIEKIISHFKSDLQIGMACGFCSIYSNGNWILENLTGKDHIRGAIKAYRKECFLQIGALKPAMGWDTVDELLAQFHGWKIKTDTSLLVKHLKPTGATYTEAAKYKQGKAFYRLRYGLPITIIASAKLAALKKQPQLFFEYISGYYKAKKEKQPFLVSEEEGRFIRNLRWKKMREKLF